MIRYVHMVSEDLNNFRNHPSWVEQVSQEFQRGILGDEGYENKLGVLITLVRKGQGIGTTDFRCWNCGVEMTRWADRLNWLNCRRLCSRCFKAQEDAVTEGRSS